MVPPVERLTFQPGMPLFREGEPGDRAYVIERGQVEITALWQGEPVRLAVLGERDLVGEMALVDDQVRSATATALEETEVVVVTRDRVRRELEGANPLLEVLLRGTLERLRTTSGMVLAQPGEAHEAAAGARRPGQDRDQRYDALRHSALRRLKTEQQLREAPDRGELSLRYQPIVSLTDGSTVGFEALVRWRHPEHGLLSPDEFIPIAEESELIHSLGLWVMETACRTLAESATGGDGTGSNGSPGSAGAPYVAVNVSAHQLTDGMLLDRLPAILEDTGLDPRRLVVEITESVLMENPETARAELERIRDLGARVFLDDFGTGYSSLSYLHRFPISALKLDRSFVTTMLDDRGSRQIVHAVGSLAAQLGLATVAEGIEEEAQVAALRDAGFEWGQGFGLAEPAERIDTARRVAG